MRVSQRERVSNGACLMPEVTEPFYTQNIGPATVSKMFQYTNYIVSSCEPKYSHVPQKKRYYSSKRLKLTGSRGHVTGDAQKRPKFSRLRM
jgi:hypothetical protein